VRGLARSQSMEKSTLQEMVLRLDPKTADCYWLAGSMSLLEQVHVHLSYYIEARIYSVPILAYHLS
jgi:hypothetical protein